MIGLQYNDRLEANAIIGHFLQNETNTFSQEKAYRLMDIVPCEKVSLWRALFGLSNTPDDEEDEDIERDSNGYLLWAVGRYRISHVWGSLAINTPTGDQYQPFSLECVLKYDRSQNPVGLFREQNAIFMPSVSRAERGSGSRVLLWKKPDNLI